jgi:hypothetical protein
MASKKKVKKAAKKKKGKRPARAMTHKTAKKTARTTKKATKKRKAPARKAAAKTTVKKKAAKKAPARRKQIVGEGDYAASRAFLKDQTGFVQNNKAKIPGMGRQARAALEGSEGPALLAAEAEARGHSKGEPSEN